MSPGPVFWQVLVGMFILTCLMAGIFYPIVDFEFIDYDVPSQVVLNPHVKGLSSENFKQVFTAWFSPVGGGAGRYSMAYYPVRTLSFALDYQLWGMDAGGFKFTSGLIHAVNVLLFFLLVLRLFRQPGEPDRSVSGWRDVSLAALSAGLIAVHPVVVEPVIWVAGREELLALLGTLGSVHFHLSARRLGAIGGRKWWAFGCHAAAALCCAAACLSNAVAVVIPLLITAYDLLTLARPRFRKILYGTCALWLVTAVTVSTHMPRLGAVPIAPVAASSAAVTELLRMNYPPDGVGVFPSAERVMYALNLYRLNLQTLAWPTRLSLVYWWKERPESFGETGVICGAIALVATGMVAWLLRRRRLALWGLIWFGLTLGPTSHVFPLDTCPRADRFLYLPLVGLAVVMAMGLQSLISAPKRRVKGNAVFAVGVLGLLLLGALSARGVWNWQTKISLWEHCVRMEPANALVQLRLAENLVAHQELARAAEHYEIVLRDYPLTLPALNKMALFLATCEQAERGDYERAIRLATRAAKLTGWKNLRILRTLAIAHDNFASDLEDDRDYARVIEHYREAIRVEPHYASPWFNLALLLATCSDRNLRRAEEAVRLAERACEEIRYSDPRGLWVLAIAYAEAGRFEMAARTTEEALRMAEMAGDADLARRLREQLEEYRRQIPSKDAGQ